MIQALALTPGITNDTRVVPNALRRRRAAADYKGQPFAAATLAQCSIQAEALERPFVAQLRRNPPPIAKSSSYLAQAAFICF